jgi:hypothetical protein
MTLKTNPITVPCPRKTLFLSPTRALACSGSPTNGTALLTNDGIERCEPDRNGNGDSSKKETTSLPKNLPPKKRSIVVPYQQDSVTNIRSGIEDHSFGITNHASRYTSVRKDPNSDGLFEADPPVFGSQLSASFLLQSPCSPEQAMDRTLTTPPPLPKRISIVAKKNSKASAGSTNATAIITNPLPWHPSFVTTTTPPSTPKRVSLDTRNNSPVTLPDSRDENKNHTDSCSSEAKNAEIGYVLPTAISAPKLLPQHSIGTTMAASALMSMMAMPPPPPGSNRKTKRTLSLLAIGGESTPSKKRRTTPPRISHCIGGSPFHNKDDDDGENCKSLSNLSDHDTNERALTLWRRNGSEIGNVKLSFPKIIPRSAGASLEKATLAGSNTPSPATSTKSRTHSPSASATSGQIKRIPRRFIDDPTLPVLKSGMRLAAPNDEEELNSLHCFVRAELLEVFVLEGSKTKDEKQHKRRKKNRPKNRGSNIQRVGIRCVHCGTKPKCQRAGTAMSTFFPKSLQDIYRGVCTWQRIHFMACKHIPDDLKIQYKALKDSDHTRGKKAHWIRTAHDMGFRNVDEHRNGIVWVGTSDAASTMGEGVLAPSLDLTGFDVEFNSRDKEIIGV